MQPTTPTNPAQRIDQTRTAAGALVEEIVHNYPPDGGGVRRWVDGTGEHSEAVSGLPIPQAEERTAEMKLADAQTVLAEAATVPAPATPADVLDILTRLGQALDGGA